MSGQQSASGAVIPKRMQMNQLPQVGTPPISGQVQAAMQKAHVKADAADGVANPPMQPRVATPVVAPKSMPRPFSQAARASGPAKSRDGRTAPMAKPQPVAATAKQKGAKPMGKKAY